MAEAYLRRIALREAELLQPLALPRMARISAELPMRLSRLAEAPYWLRLGREGIASRFFPLE